MKHKRKYDSRSSDDTSSSSGSCSPASDRKKRPKKHCISDSSDEQESFIKTKKKCSGTDSDNEKYRKKSVKSEVITKRHEKEKLCSSHSVRKLERKHDSQEKYDRDEKKNQIRRNRYDGRRDGCRDISRFQEHIENRSAYHHRQHRRDLKENSKYHDNIDGNVNDKRRERTWNRRQRSRSKSLDHANANWGKNSCDSKSDKRTKEKEKPNFGLSGKLTEETNMYKGVVIKYSEPAEARKPRRRWRLYPFKGEKSLQTLYIHRQSAYLIGRDRKIADLPVDHPSCSKQHAALQYRLVQFTREDGSVGKRVRPYIIDLESANGTFVNNKKVEAKKYIELLERDVIKFGFSSREYVLLHENSKDEALDDDVKLEEGEELKIKNE